MAKFLELIVTTIVIPLLKDLVFALINSYKIRQIRKKLEEESKLKRLSYKVSKTEEEIKKTFENLP